MKLKAVAIVLAALVAPQAIAKPARAIGKMYANAALCRVEGRITKFQNDIIKINITKKYEVAIKSSSFKDRVSDSQVDELNRMINNGSKGSALMCAALKNKWL